MTITELFKWLSFLLITASLIYLVAGCSYGTYNERGSYPNQENNCIKGETVK